MTAGWPAVADPTTAPTIPAPRSYPDRVLFPVAVDPALIGHDPLAVTAADAGLADDPIAVVLELRARLEDAIDRLTPAQRAELAREYGIGGGTHLKAVA